MSTVDMGRWGQEDTQAAPNDTTKLVQKSLGSHLPLSDGIRNLETPFTCLFSVWSSECCTSELDMGLPDQRESKGRKRLGCRMLTSKAEPSSDMHTYAFLAKKCVICLPTKKQAGKQVFYSLSTRKSSYLLVKNQEINS